MVLVTSVVVVSNCHFICIITLGKFQINFSKTFYRSVVLYSDCLFCCDEHSTRPNGLYKRKENESADLQVLQSNGKLNRNLVESTIFVFQM